MDYTDSPEGQYEMEKFEHEERQCDEDCLRKGEQDQNCAKHGEVAMLKVRVEKLKDALAGVMDALADMPADPADCWPEQWKKACDALDD